MDLIWMDSNLVEQGILENAVFDSEVGSYYDFTLTVPKKYYQSLRGAFVFPRGALEFGGKILSCSSRSDDGFVTFAGKTWFGLLGMQGVMSFSYVTGQYTYKMSDYLLDLLAAANYYPLISPNTDYVFAQSATVPDYVGKELTDVQALTEDLYRQANKTPTWSARYNDGVMTILLGAKNKRTYSAADYSSDVLPVEIETHYQHITEILVGYKQSNNTLIWWRTGCLTTDGTWLDSLVEPIRFDYTGFAARKVCVVLSEEEATAAGRFNFAALADSLEESGSASISIASGIVPDVGDTVTGKDQTTGIAVTAVVTSKSLHVDDGYPILSFETA